MNAVDTPDRAGTWIVGHDDSEPAEQALEWALAHAVGRAERIDVVTAWQPPVYGPYPADAAAMLPYDDGALARATAGHVQEVAAAAADRVSLPVSGSAAEGGAAEVLLDAATGADLLVIGSRGRGGFHRLLLGSTSSQCASHATCPTVVVRGTETASTTRVLVGVDGSPNSLAAVEWAIRFAGPGSTVVAGAVWDNSPIVFGADDFFFPEASSLAEDRIGAMIDEIEARVAAPSVTVERRFAPGRPRDLLHEWSTDTDLVVVGARGLSGLGAALLGSVTTWLIHHLDRPVAVIPHHADDAAG